MIYRNLASAVDDLERTGRLRRIDCPVDPRLEIGVIQRRAFERKGPALLFTNVRGTRFPMLGNLFGTMERTRYLFRSTLKGLETLFRLKADPMEALRHPLRHARLPFSLLSAFPKKVKDAPVFTAQTSLGRLPQLVSWPKDGGGYVTLPQVYTEHPAKAGFFHSNLGMYRVQMTGGSYAPDREAGLHYQIHRGIGPHHAEALARGEDLRVVVSVGGPPALAMAALFPMPENLPEIYLAGILAGHRIPMAARNGSLPVPAEADFAIIGRVRGRHTAPEGPFGDHMGYYSLEHDFPVLTVDAVYHRENAIWPFTTVGRPPQEDTVFGEFIHDLTRELVPGVFHSVREVHAVDAAGVHPLLLAVGRERYVPFAGTRQPQELITGGLSLLGSTQTSLAKYVLMGAWDDAPGLSAGDVPAFFGHMLARTDFSRDLHFVTRTTMDTLDYTGISLNQGSKLVWTAAGPEKRRLATALPGGISLPEEFGDLRLFTPGVLVCRGPAHVLPPDTQDAVMEKLAASLAGQRADLGGSPWLWWPMMPVFAPHRGAIFSGWPLPARTRPAICTAWARLPVANTGGAMPPSSWIRGSNRTRLHPSKRTLRWNGAWMHSARREGRCTVLCEHCGKSGNNPGGAPRAAGIVCHIPGIFQAQKGGSDKTVTGSHPAVRLLPASGAEDRKAYSLASRKSGAAASLSEREKGISGQAMAISGSFQRMEPSSSGW